MLMLEFITEHMLEIIFGLISAGALAFCKYAHSQIKEYKQILSEKEKEEAEALIENKLDPIVKDIEELRQHILNTDMLHEKHLQLILSSYRFRLICLCKEFIKQGYLTPEQYDQLSEFYITYTGLGGNGQAQEYYEMAVKLPVREVE